VIINFLCKNFYKMRRVSCLFLLIVLSQIVYAQNGKITGKVISAASGQALSGATLFIIGKNITKVADLNGVFSFGKLDSGTYSMKCSYVGFEDKIVEEIVVKNNENTDVNISLEAKLSGGITVTGIKKVKAAGATVESLLVAQKNSASVSDGITEQSIKKTSDSKGSDVIKRVSGASIQDDKFAVIRGLNDRYNAAFINGAPLPSTESDRKAFAFDIFPSAILENLIIYKTATPDKSGEFAGGIIEITTKSTSSKRIGSITIGQGYNSLITGENRMFNEMKGKNDWLGLDDGSRAVPDGIPADKNGVGNLTFDERLHLAKRFSKYKWGTKTANTRPNFNFQLVKSFNIDRKQQEFISSVFSLTYNRSFTFVTGERNSYVNPDYSLDPSDPSYFPQQIRKAKDSIYNDEIIWAALGNIGIKINNRNSISWKNNLSVNTDNRFVRRFGNVDLTFDSANIQQETLMQFISDKIYSSQLIGEHQVGKMKTKINWLAGYSEVSRVMPNQLLLSPGLLAGGSAARGAPGGMISTNSQEILRSAKIDITQPYTFIKNSQNFIKIGAGYQIREREFGTRDLNFIQYEGTTYQKDFSVINLPDDQRFLGQYLGPMANGKASISVQDGTVPNSEYVASSTNTHAYIMNDQRFFKKLRLIAGLRMESFNQKLASPQRGLGEVNINYTKVDFLPSANLVFALTPKTNLRASYSETVNRPEFRELASFGFYEFISGLFIYGNPNITRAKINNYDFRYEIYPGKSQLLSVSAFYKKFTNPIEFILSPLYPSEATYENKLSSTLYGVEAEFRVLLSTLFGKKNENTLLSKFTLTGNGAYMKSKVPLGLSKDSSIELSRPLQGQSPYIINGSLGYSDENTGLSSTLSLNRIGERLVLGGSALVPDVYDRERTVIDFQIAKTFLDSKVEVKFNIRDLLAQNITTYFDYDKTRSFTEKDRIFSSNISPRVFSFSATFKF
jgi:outer membrane receptor protein involved in Fe transport